MRRALASETFGRSERSRKLLAYLVEKSLAGEADRLKGFAIAVDVFDKDADFDPSTDAAVRVQAGRLRELLAQYFQGEGAAEPLRIAIPRGSYVPTYEAVAPLPETDEPHLPDRLPVAIQAKAPGIGLAFQIRLVWSALALVAAMLALLSYKISDGGAAASAWTQASTAAALRPRSVDALPIVHIVDEAGTDAAYRVQAALRRGLAGFDTIDLFSDEPGHHRAADPLQYEYRLTRGPTEGSITIELSNVARGRVLLSRVLGGDDLEEKILDDRIAAVLTATAPVSGTIYADIERVGAGSELIQCLIRADDYHLQQRETALVAAYRCLARLAEAESNSTLVYAELASLILEARAAGYRSIPETSLDAALQRARRAVQIHPTSPYAHRAYGYFLARSGERHESIRWMRKAYELNTYDLSMAAAYAYSLIFSGQYEPGILVMERAVEASSARPPWWDYSLFIAYFMKGDVEKAAQASRALSTTKRAHYLVARLVSAQEQGRTADVDDLASELRASYPALLADPRGTFRNQSYPDDLINKLVGALRQAGLAGAS